MSAFHHTVKTVTPFHDRSRHSRLLKITLWLVGIAVVLAICHVGGFDVLGWFESVWDTMKEIAPAYIVAGVFFQTIQTTLTALAWYFILAAGYPEGGVRYRDILAAYAAGVAMNGFLPANIGTFASLLMYVALIRGATFAGVIGATLVQKGNRLRDTGDFQSLGGDTLPNSLYRTSKPPWFNDLEWPPYDPVTPRTPSIEDIPAGYRFVHGVDPPGGPPTPPQPPTGLTATPSPGAGDHPTAAPGRPTAGPERPTPAPERPKITPISEKPLSEKAKAALRKLKSP